jgi:hypothetical protein
MFVTQLQFPTAILIILLSTNKSIAVIVQLMFQDFLAKKMLSRHGVSAEQAEAVIKLVKQNPALFQQIAAEIKAKVAAGADEQSAALEVMTAHKDELSKLSQK